MPPKSLQTASAGRRSVKRRTAKRLDSKRLGSKPQSGQTRKSKRTRRTDEQRLRDLEQEIAELKAKVKAGRCFSAEAVRKDRARLQLSAADYATLVGVSMLTVYNWEKGRSQARAKQITAWRSVCDLSLEEAWEQLGYEVD